MISWQQEQLQKYEEWERDQREELVMGGMGPGAYNARNLPEPSSTTATAPHSLELSVNKAGQAGPQGPGPASAATESWCSQVQAVLRSAVQILSKRVTSCCDSSTSRCIHGLVARMCQLASRDGWVPNGRPSTWAISQVLTGGTALAISQVRGGAGHRVGWGGSTLFCLLTPAGEMLQEA